MTTTRARDTYTSRTMRIWSEPLRSAQNLLISEWFQLFLFLLLLNKTFYKFLASMTHYYTYFIYLYFIYINI